MKNKVVKQEDQHEKEEDKKEDKRVEELEQQLVQLEDQFKRAVADYRNLEKRVADERVQMVQFANRDLLLKLFPAFDTLFLASQYVEDEGLKLTIRKLTEVLKDAGVERLEVTGRDFDPHTMEAVVTEEGEENKVLQELRPGYTLFGKVLRPAHVKVGKKS